MRRRAFGALPPGAYWTPPTIEAQIESCTHAEKWYRAQGMLELANNSREAVYYLATFGRLPPPNLGALPLLVKDCVHYGPT